MEHLLKLGIYEEALFDAYTANNREESEFILWPDSLRRVRIEKLTPQDQSRSL
jgi:hypothetical protein